MTPFLTAVWSDLILMSYAVPDDVLLPYLPRGLELDKWEGSAWCSLVAFDFKQTRVLGWSVPYPKSLCDFPEFNLRFYVKQKGQRGVVFVRELAPNPLVCGLAKLLYNEPYTAVPITSRVTQIGDVRRVRHDFVVDGRKQMVAVSAHGPATLPPEDGFEAWVKEQEAGFNHQRFGGKATGFRVWHPAWRIYPVEEYAMNIDFAHLYGSQWAFLQGRKPDSVVLAEGSQIEIYPNETRK
jgi:uncharacterized protein YqjF (DUF2071 family)